MKIAISVNVTQDKTMTEKYPKLRLLHMLSGFIKY